MPTVHNDVIYRENIRNYLIERAHAVRVDTKGNLMNLSVLSEDFYVEFLNILLGLKLENANASEQDTAGIDLVDWESKVAVQVSVTCAPQSIRKKIQGSIDKFDKPSSELWQFYFVPITDKAPDLTKDFRLPEDLVFDIHNDVLDISRIMDLAKGIDKLKMLSALIDKYSKPEVSQKDPHSCAYLENATAFPPRYISDPPNSGVDQLWGRDKDLCLIREHMSNENGKLLISSIGGMGKTELAKKYVFEIMSRKREDSAPSTVAWIPYISNDFRMSVKQALHLKCEVDDVWFELQRIADSFQSRLLIVIDNADSTYQDEYLKKLESLPCRVLVTSRCREMAGFPNTLFLEPLSFEECRNLFYNYYALPGQDNETLNAVIQLTARLTIMIVFLAKVAFLEGLSIRELYNCLVDKGFKLSEEQVSSEHERLAYEASVIHQMCILFSLVPFGNAEKELLTNISIIPTLKFDVAKAKRWFGISRNGQLHRLYQVGMLEHAMNGRKHLYWMHTVIAAALREQQKESLYPLARPFIRILTEELDSGPAFGREYEKIDLIPFSWSVSDIMERQWSQEEDTDFLMSLFHVCFACSHFRLCEQLIDTIIHVQETNDTFSALDLVNSYKNKIDLLLQLDRANEAANYFSKAEQLISTSSFPEDRRDILDSQYGILYQIRGNYEKSRIYFERCIKRAEKSESEVRNKDISTTCTNMARMLVDAGQFFEAYEYIKRAIDVDDGDEYDADTIISYSTLCSICTELIGAGYGTTYIDEAIAAFKKVISFREKHLGKHHADTAAIYHDYAYFWYICGQYKKALKYNQMACTINEELFSEYSITSLRALNTKAIILWDMGDRKQANLVFEKMMLESEQLSDDYLIDVADFSLNYARCLHEEENDSLSKEYYGKCIEIWKSLSASGNRKLALACQERGEILLSEGLPQEALNDFKTSLACEVDDFYILIDVLDSLAACEFLCGNYEASAESFVRVIQLLAEHNATDAESKYVLCNNLLCVLDAQSGEELSMKRTLLAAIDSEQNLVEYINSEYIPKIMIAQ